ncbi:MAG: hypothetical protein IJI44_07505 [Erysipelotrichaceae bacterium]|nr:hypothetical protein [Erysipelotrichaceae bacterium]
MKPDNEKQMKEYIREIWTEFNNTDPEDRKKIMDHTFEFIIDDIGSGWEYVSIILDEKIKRNYRVSYIGPTVTGFVRTFMTLGLNQTEQFTWLDEPSYIEYPWLLSRQKDVIYVEAPGIKKGFYISYDYLKKQIRKGFEEMYKWEIVGI